MTGIPPIVRTARRLRKRMSLPEAMLWQQLRQRPGGVKFRRQHAIGEYVVDFYCAAARLAVEVDGHSHDCGDRPARDEHRDDWLAQHGIRCIRIAAARVLADPIATAERLAALANVSPNVAAQRLAALATVRLVGPPLHRQAAVPLPEDGEDRRGSAHARSLSWNT